MTLLSLHHFKYKLVIVNAREIKVFMACLFLVAEYFAKLFYVIQLIKLSIFKLSLPCRMKCQV
jgi:hypothetical protein